MKWVKAGGVRERPKPLPYTTWGTVKADRRSNRLVKSQIPTRLPDPTEKSVLLGYTPLIDPTTGHLREAEIRMSYQWTDVCVPELESAFVQDLADVPHLLSVFPSWQDAMDWKAKPGNLLVTDEFEFDDLVIERSGHRTYTVDDGRVKVRITGQSDGHAMSQLIQFMQGHPVDASTAVLH